MNKNCNKWNRIKAGHYQSPNRHWRIIRERRKWFIYQHENELWGNWENGPYGKEYVPWKTLRDAKVEWDEFQIRGFQGDYPPRP